MTGAERRHNVVMVAGYDYSNLTSPDRMRSFGAIARHRCAQILAGRSDTPALRCHRGPLRITLLDLGSGAVRAIDRDASGTVVDHVLEQRAPVGPVNYRWQRPGRLVFCHEPAPVLSILDVYATVERIGLREPGTLVELSFIAHGWAGGPTLVNSDDTIDRDPTRPTRDDDPRAPLDKDGRRYKDFRPPTTSPGKLAGMRRAFASDGYVWNWGCNNSLASGDVLDQTVRFWASSGGAMGMDTRVPFAFTADDAATYFDVDRWFFPPRSDPGHRSRFERSVADIADFLRGRVLATYNARIAVALDRPCFGALPGLPSDFETTGPNPQMVVPRSGDYVEDFSAEVRFYATFLGFGLDPEARGYGCYEPRWLASAEAAVTDRDDGPGPSVAVCAAAQAQGAS